MGDAEPSIVADRTALVLVEFQRQWTDPGFYKRIIAAQLDGRSVLETSRRFAADARRAGVTVIHAPLVLDPANKRGALAHLTRARVFTKGTPRAALTDGVYADGDFIATGRTGFDAFGNSTLERELRTRALNTLLIAGFTTDQCVSKTLGTALSKGFDGWLLSDCCAAPSDWLARRAERRFKDHALTAAQARRALAIQASADAPSP